LSAAFDFEVVLDFLPENGGRRRAKGAMQAPNTKSKSNTNTKGSGQECPLHTDKPVTEKATLISECGLLI
jgi:hypothetical protein